MIAGTLFAHSGHDLDGAQNRLSFFAFTVAAAVFTANDSIPALMRRPTSFDGRPPAPTKPKTPKPQNPIKMILYFKDYKN